LTALFVLFENYAILILGYVTVHTDSLRNLFLCTTNGNAENKLEHSEFAMVAQG